MLVPTMFPPMIVAPKTKQITPTTNSDKKNERLSAKRNLAGSEGLVFALSSSVSSVLLRDTDGG